MFFLLYRTFAHKIYFPFTVAVCIAKDSKGPEASERKGREPCLIFEA
jgi:hypothetical protein